MRHKTWVWRAAGVITASIAGNLVAVAHASSVSLTSFNTAYTQNFDTLSNTGTTNSSLPVGWAINESGTSGSVNQQYRAGTGSNNVGDTYSFGASGSAERALGTLGSNTLTPIIGVAFSNNTGGIIDSLNVSYFGEQWRLGQTIPGRSPDRLDFQYSLNATSLTTGTWLDFNPLDFSSLVTAGTVGALDGNSAVNRTALSGSLTSLNIANGTTFWLRWNEFDLRPGAEDGLAVDDFSLTAVAAVPLPAAIWLLVSGLSGLAFVQGRSRKMS